MNKLKALVILVWQISLFMLYVSTLSALVGMICWKPLNAAVALFPSLPWGLQIARPLPLWGVMSFVFVLVIAFTGKRIFALLPITFTIPNPPQQGTNQ